MKPYRVAFSLSVLLLCSSCAQNMQRDLDQQGKAITILQQKTQELDRSLRRLQADYHSELDRMSVELQSMKAGIDESKSRTDKAVAELDARLSTLPGSGGGGEGQSAGPSAESMQGPGSGETGEVAFPSAPKPLDEREMYNQAYGLFSGGDYSSSLKLFQEFLKQYPGSSLTDNAMYWIANIYYKQKKFEETISACDDVIKKFPRGNKTPDAYYLQSLAFCEIKDPLTAQILLETLIQNFPGTDAASLGKKKYDELKGKSSR